jgi:pyrimidine deaminase RibD-like protein
MEMAVQSKVADYDAMLMAIEEARRCVSEPGRLSPKVGAVVVRDGVVLGAAHRGERASGDHAEYTLLETKLANEDLTGTSLFTTLEPCTTRNHPKIPCAARIVERGIGKVFIGVLDPNEQIQGDGYFLLWEAGIGVVLFDPDLKPQVLELNPDFHQFHRLRGINGLQSRAGIFADAVSGFMEQELKKKVDPFPGARPLGAVVEEYYYGNGLLQDADTIQLYRQQFGKDVAALRNMLAVAGRYDSELERAYGNPTTTRHIYAVINGLTRLSKGSPTE